MQVGIDIVEHKRINIKIAHKILTSKEMIQFNSLKSSQARTEYLSSRIAAKEAIIKATNLKYKFKDIEVLRTSGKPKLNIKNINLSISHERNYSTAICIIE